MCEGRKASARCTRGASPPRKDGLHLDLLPVDLPAVHVIQGGLCVLLVLVLDVSELPRPARVAVLRHRRVGEETENRPCGQPSDNDQYWFTKRPRGRKQQDKLWARREQTVRKGGTTQEGVKAYQRLINANQLPVDPEDLTKMILCYISAEMPNVQLGFGRRSR